MHSDSVIFNGATTPLVRGTTLIEASAGTGKTFAISMLVLRAVTELAVDLKEILVVTYTVAATEELRGRIRERLVQARNYLSSSPGSDDRVLSEWRQHLHDPEEAARRLELALLDIDSMSIHTIHSFCQRILSEQVLESGHFFDTDLIADTTAVRNEIVRDFWRNHLYSSEPRYSSVITGRYPGPVNLYQSIKGAESPLCHLLPEELSFGASCEAN